MLNCYFNWRKEPDTSDDLCSSISWQVLETLAVDLDVVTKAYITTSLEEPSGSW
jgi:hypothetical protein